LDELLVSDGGWSEWQGWSAFPMAPQTAETGEQIRIRECNNPVPQSLDFTNHFKKPLPLS